MTMSNRACAIALLVAGALAGRPGSAAAQIIPGWLKDHTDQWYAAFNAGDPAAMGRMYAPDAVLSLQGEVFEGRTAIEAFHKDNFAKAQFKCTFSIKGTATVDRIATVWGDDTCVDTPRAGGPPGNWQGHWLTVYQFEPDGTWKIVRDSAEDARLLPK